MEDLRVGFRLARGEFSTGRVRLPLALRREHLRRDRDACEEVRCWGGGPRLQWEAHAAREEDVKEIGRGVGRLLQLRLLCTVFVVGLVGLFGFVRLDVVSQLHHSRIQKEHWEADRLQIWLAPQQRDQLTEAGRVQSQLFDKVRLDGPLLLCLHELRDALGDLALQSRCPFALEGAPAVLGRSLCGARGAVLKWYMVANQFSGSVELPSGLVHDLHLVQHVPFAQLGRGLFDVVFGGVGPRDDYDQLAALVDDTRLAMLHARDVSDSLLQGLQLNANAPNLHLPIGSSMVVDPAPGILGNDVVRAIHSPIPGHHKFAGSLLLVVQVAPSTTDAAGVQNSSLALGTVLQLLCLLAEAEHPVRVGGQVVPNRDLVPGFHSNAAAHHSDLRRAVDVEHRSPRGPSVQYIPAQSLATDVQHPKMWQRNRRDVHPWAQHGPKVGGYCDHQVHLLVAQPREHVWTRPLHDVRDDDARGALEHGAVDLGHVVVEGHGGHLRGPIRLPETDEVAPDTDQVACGGMLDHDCFRFASGSTREDDVAEPVFVGRVVLNWGDAVDLCIGLVEDLVDVQDEPREVTPKGPALLCEFQSLHHGLGRDHDRVLGYFDPTFQFFSGFVCVEGVVDAPLQHRRVDCSYALGPSV
mmetsp:Transcript_64515/g.135394  ORF Transcript_64515/g.135394 Transcript_64515/m.135394 type:complete len:637 (+) Transcript_64515:3975-5885(+)